MVKRRALLVLLGFGIIVLASAKGKDPWHRGFPPGGPPVPAETVAITGNLTIAQGTLAVNTNDITYLVFGLDRFIGFIDSLKEGAMVTLQGSAAAYPLNDKIKFLRVNKLTINGKDYDMTPLVGAGFPQPLGHPYGKRR